MSQYLIFLAILPLICFEICKLFRCSYKNTIYGISLGLVITPVSFALVQFTYIPVIGKFIGLVGLLVHLVHCWFGYGCMIGMGVLEPGATVSTMQLDLVHSLNGLFFAIIYGLAGYFRDLRIRNTVFTRSIFPKLSY